MAKKNSLTESPQDTTPKAQDDAEKSAGKTNQVEKCCLCNQSIDVQHFQNGNEWFRGYNAQPVKEGRCCSECNGEVGRQRYVAYDVGLITYDGRKIKGDPLEQKRQALMSEGEVELDDTGQAIIEKIQKTPDNAEKSAGEQEMDRRFIRVSFSNQMKQANGSDNE